MREFRSMRLLLPVILSVVLLGTATLSAANRDESQSLHRTGNTPGGQPPDHAHGGGPPDHAGPRNPDEVGNRPVNRGPVNMARQQFIDAGHKPGDVDTAMILAQQTGLSASVFLNDRKNGKAWTDIVEERARGLVGPNPNAAKHTGPAIDNDMIELYVAQGHERGSVIYAASLARDYDTTTDVVLAMRSAHGSWEPVRTELIRLQNAARTIFADDDFAFALEPSGRTASGMNAEAVQALLDEGFSVSSIWAADRRAAELGITGTDVLHAIMDGMSMEEITQQVHSREFTPGNGRGYTRGPGHGHGPGGGNQGGQPNLPAAAGKRKVVMETLGLSEHQVDAYLAEGFDETDLMNAHHYAAHSGKGLNMVLEDFVTVGRDWAKVGARPPARSLDDDDADLAAQWAEHLGVETGVLLTERQKGKEWGQIASELATARAAANRPHEPRPEGKTAAEVAADFGISVEDLRAGNLGRRPEHAGQRQPGDLTAEELAEQYGISVEELNARAHAPRANPHERSVAHAAAEAGMSVEQFLKASTLQMDGPRARHVLIDLGFENDNLPRGISVEEMLEQRRSSSEPPKADSDPVVLSAIQHLYAHGVTDEQIQAMDEMGLDLSDMNQAAHIAEAVGIPVLEVAKLKHTDNNWIDVIRMLSSARISEEVRPSNDEGHSHGHGEHPLHEGGPH